MARDKIRYLVEKNGRFYWQPNKALREAGWLPTRLSVDQASAEQEALGRNKDVDAWRRGERPVVLDNGPKKPRVEPGTVRFMVDRYEASEEFTDLAPSTQRGYKQNLEVLARWAGSEPVRSLTKQNFKKFYKQLRTGTPAKARAVMVMAQILWAWGADQSPKLAPSENPASKLKLKSIPPSGRIWPREAVTAFVDAADRLGWHSIGTAVTLNEWICQREGDVLNLPRNVLRERGLIVRQRKTGAGVVLPIAMVPALSARVEAELARHAGDKVQPTRLLICEATGQPWKADHFRHVFAAIKQTLANGDEAKGIKPLPRVALDYVLAGADPNSEDAYTCPIQDLQFMHLRHTGMVRHREALTPKEDIAALSGHSLNSLEAIMDRYLVRTGEQARAAFARRMEAEASAARKGATA